MKKYVEYQGLFQRKLTFYSLIISVNTTSVFILFNTSHTQRVYKKSNSLAFFLKQTKSGIQCSHRAD